MIYKAKTKAIPKTRKDPGIEAFWWASLDGERWLCLTAEPTAENANECRQILEDANGKGGGKFRIHFTTRYLHGIGFEFQPEPINENL